MIPWTIVLGALGVVMVLVAKAYEPDQDGVGIHHRDPLHLEWVTLLDAAAQER